LRWWEYHNTLRTEGVACRSCAAPSHDVTERLEAEKAQRESETRFRQMAESIQEVFFLIDAANTRMLYVSPAYEHVWGSSVTSLYEKPLSWTDPIHPDDRAIVEANLAGMQDTGKFDYEYRITRPDGAVRWIRARGFPIRNGAGAIYRIAGVAEDITDRKSAEAESRKLALAVRQSGTGVVITDPAGTIEFVNPKFETITGYTAAEAMGRNPRLLKSGATARETYRNLWATISAGKEWRGELQNRRKNGELYWENQHISPVLDESGKIQHFIAVKEDITERKQAEKKIDGLNRVYAVLSGINALIVRVRDKEELLRGACQIAVEAGRFHFGVGRDGG
jgi:PAS domain S-box-containing protein